MNKINSEFNACMHKDACIKLQSRIAQLESELEEAKKDQARYQTMRKAIVNCDRKVEEILLQNQLTLAAMMNLMQQLILQLRSSNE